MGFSSNLCLLGAARILVPLRKYLAALIITS
jgi:hypothetical protein